MSWKNSLLNSTLAWAAKQNEINQLKGISDKDNPTTTMSGDSNTDSTMSTEAKLKASEQQKANGYFVTMRHCMA